MKKLVVLFVLAAISFSCSKSDDSVNVTEAKLVGKWYYKTTKVAGETFPYDDHEACGKDYIQFREDGFVVYGDVWDCELFEDVAGVWSISGDKITITEDGVPQTATVTTLNSSTLVVKYKDDYFEDGSEVTIVVTFTRS
ncbi:MAG: lipocalin family protein [Flavobacteriales bacterium]|uniref:lipocalin family protein n=2 Tax=Flavobacterium TaxID=237 RepID=UPI00042A50CA|nr:lipocalin family protein [Flavobacterium filum]MBN8567239.1 lipocalin family protein [Flavobacteriales bacterium]